jgi:hypothetical protein
LPVARDHTTGAASASEPGRFVQEAARPVRIQRDERRRAAASSGRNGVHSCERGDERLPADGASLGHPAETSAPAIAAAANVVMKSVRVME